MNELFTITFFFDDKKGEIESRLSKSKYLGMGVVYQVLKEYLEHTESEATK